MKNTFIILPSLVSMFFIALSATSQTEYVCTPCGDCDTVIYDKPGTCSACGMEFIDKSLVKHTNITIPDVCNIVSANKDVVILDVRSKEEFERTHKIRPNEGKLKGAININIEELETRLAEIISYKDRGIIVYCSHARRSQRASHILTQNGFTNVKNMLEGITAWGNYKSACSSDLFIK